MTGAAMSLAITERNLGQLGESGFTQIQPVFGVVGVHSTGVHSSGASGLGRERPHEEILLLFREGLEVRGYRPGTISEYVRMMRDFLGVAGAFPSGLTPDACLAYQKRMFYAKPLRGAKANYSLASQRYALTTMKVFCRWCVKRGFVATDPSTRVDLPRQRAALPRTVLTKEETGRLLSAPDVAVPEGYRDRAVMEVLYSTGLRNSEVCGLDFTDVDLRERLLLVRDGKGGRDRRVPFSPEASEWIEGYIREIRAKFDRGLAPTAIFLGGNGRRIDGRDVCLSVAEYAKKAGIARRVTPHVLRHSFATHLIQEGANIRYVQELLGHASPETTMIYTHVSATDLKRVHDKFHPRERL